MTTTAITVKPLRSPSRTSPIRFAAMTAMGCLSFLLAGCGGGNLLPQDVAPETQVSAAPEPQPTQPPQPQVMKMTLAPIIGAPDEQAKRIQQEMMNAGIAQRIAFLTNEPSQMTVRGYFVAAKDKTGSKISYIWDVTGQSGKLHRVAGEELGGALPAGSKDAWVSLTPLMIQQISAKSVANLAQWLATQPVAAPALAGNFAPAGAPAGGGVTAVAGAAAAAVSPRATASTAVGTVQPASFGASVAAPQRVSFAMVPAVSGAPGDGASSLTQALRAELGRSGLPAGAGADPSYRVEGVVRLGQANGSNQAIQIDWHVKDPTGRRIGTVSQKNDIPAGSLDGAWGEAATSAAGAAAQGIVKLIRENQASTAG